MFQVPVSITCFRVHLSVTCLTDTCFRVPVSVTCFMVPSFRYLFRSPVFMVPVSATSQGTCFSHLFQGTCFRHRVPHLLLCLQMLEVEVMAVSAKLEATTKGVVGEGVLQPFMLPEQYDSLMRRSHFTAPPTSASPGNVMMEWLTERRHHAGRRGDGGGRPIRCPGSGSDEADPAGRGHVSGKRRRSQRGSPPGAPGESPAV